MFKRLGLKKRKNVLIRKDQIRLVLSFWRKNGLLELQIGVF